MVVYLRDATGAIHGGIAAFMAWRWGFLWPVGHLHVPSSSLKKEGDEPMRGESIEPYDEAKVWGT
jgi:hypothetical protein